MQEVNQQHPALQLFDAGYGEDIIPVIPPGARLSSSTKIRVESCGKIPGKQDSNGDWFGFKNWPTHPTTRHNVEHDFPGLRDGIGHLRPLQGFGAAGFADRDRIHTGDAIPLVPGSAIRNIRGS